MARLPQPTETPAPPAHQMWGGRFSVGGGPSEALDALNRSLPVDHRLWPQDVAASKAWVHALGRAGVLAPAEESQLLDGLDRVAERLADGAAVGAPDEDVHTLVERLLYEEIGAAAGKLHTGRSRNDQVATDLRLWTLGAIDQLDGDLAALGRTLVEPAPAEAQSRRVRARPRQGRAPARRSGGARDDAQGPARGVQQGPAGGQGAAVRRVRHARPGAPRGDRRDRRADRGRGADAGGARCVPASHRPRRPAGRGGGAVPRESRARGPAGARGGAGRVAARPGPSLRRGRGPPGARGGTGAAGKLGGLGGGARDPRRGIAPLGGRPAGGAAGRICSGGRGLTQGLAAR